MQTYLTDAFSALTENEPWITELQTREPIVYITARIFGILLFIGFIAAMLAIVFAINKATVTHGSHQMKEYEYARNEAAHAVVASLRSQNVPDNEIKDILRHKYGFDTETANMLLSRNASL